MSEESSEKQVEKDAEEIVSEGTQITEKISSLILLALKASEEGLSRFGDITGSVLQGAFTAVDKTVPEDSESTLRQVFDGISGAGEKAADSLKLTLEEARGRSEVFTEEEMKKTLESLGTLEQLFFDTVENFAKKSKSEFSTQLENIVEHTKRTGSSIRPSLEAAINAVKDHPTELVSESLQAGAALSKNITGSLLGTMAQYLDTAAKSLTEDDNSEKKE